MNQKYRKSSDLIEQLYHSLYYHQVKKDWIEVDNVLNEIKKAEEAEELLREKGSGTTGVYVYEEGSL